MLYGRSTETAVLDGVLDDARDSRSAVLVLRGEPGIGKTSLLGSTVARATDFRVLRGLGVESESELAFAALHRILRPVLGYATRIPNPQEEALRSAFGLAPARGVDRFLISLAVLSLLAEVAEDGPLLCLVDDGHWLDQPSSDALVFAARRLEAERVALLFSTRADERRPFDAPDLAHLEVGGLDRASGLRLLADQAGVALGPGVGERLVDSARGNPLALRQLPGLLAEDQLSGREPLPDPLPVGAWVEEAFLDRVRRLPPGAQDVLVLLAADDTGNPSVLARAAASLGRSGADLEAAEGAGLTDVEDDRVAFRHPLVRSAVYQQAGSARRRAVHRALADALDGEADADRRAWHLASASVGPSPAVADELERAAGRARRRSGYLAASTALERAAQLSPGPGEQARRLTAAAEAAWLGGRGERALMLADRADALGPEVRVRADIQHLRGIVQLRCGVPADSHALLMAAARDVAPVDPEKALLMLFDSGQAAGYAGDAGAVIEAGRRAAELPVTSPEAAFVIGLLSGVASLMEGTSADAVEAVRALVARATDFDDPRWLVWAGAAAAATGDERAEYALYRRASALARASAAVTTLTNVLEAFNFAGMLDGRYPAVAADAAEGLRLAREAGLANSACQHLATLAFVAAVRGREAECRSWAAEVSEQASLRGLGLPNAIAEWALALLDLGLGRPAETLDRLVALRAGGPGTTHPFVVLNTVPDLVEAAVRADQADAAAPALAGLERFAERGTAPGWALALRGRCRGLLSAPATAERHFDDALRLHAHSQRSFDRARTQLAYGEHLRRSRRRLAAREHLRAALHEFERVGAAPWAARARTELRATGEHAHRRGSSTLDQLTPQELQIARFVAEGATNKEVGAQLFISPRTVDHHLRRVFAKLGITSRAELIVLRVAEHPPVPAP